MSIPIVSNSPVNQSNYKWLTRRSFLYNALRTKSLYAREELEALASESTLAKLDLAWVVSNQNLSETDLFTAFEIYQQVLQTKGKKAFSQMHSIDFAILATKLGQAAAATNSISKLVNLYGLLKYLIPKHLASVPMQVIQEGKFAFVLFKKDYSVPAKFLQLEIANPLRGLSHKDSQQATQEPNVQKWMARLGGELFDSSLEKLKFAKPEHDWQTPFDLLSADVKKPIALRDQPKVTVVMSAFHPAESIFTAVRSAIEQTYQNLEILVIDDCSPAEFDGIFDQIAKMDDRVKVLRQSENGGTYRIRNRALDEATGHYVTFQDSDDYMHPRRIELQVKNLEKNPKKVANISLSTRLTDRLEAVESNRRLRIGICEPALMFRRELVRDRIGYFDSVRKSADSEYRKRIMKAFDQDLLVVHPFKILTIQRTDNGGLTQGELGFRWISEFRLIYRDCYLDFHRAGAKVDWRIEREGERAFYAPRQSLFVGSEARQPRKFDVIFAANFRDNKQIPKTVQLIEQANSAGKKVGLLQVNSLYPLFVPLGNIKKPIVAALNNGQAEMVFAGDKVTCETIELLAPTTFALSYSGEKFDFEFNAVNVHYDSQESFKAAGIETSLTQVLQQANLA